MTRSEKAEEPQAKKQSEAGERTASQGLQRLG